MIFTIGHNICSPLGMTTAENLAAVRRGVSSIKTYPHLWNLPEPVCASLFSDDQWAEMAMEDCTPFESMVIASATRALKDCAFDVAGKDVVLIVSTTKANVGQLDDPAKQDACLFPGMAAKYIARRLGVTTQPVVVDDACVSGVAALITATRLLEDGDYHYAIVCGADHQNRFIVSGFQSFKALSQEPCRPFDMERSGLNLGEAAATLILSTEPSATDHGWIIRQGAIRNDAYHISAPSRQGEGARRALLAALDNSLASDEKGAADSDTLAVINAHGTATLFNDQMESKAIERAGLSDTPVNGYKGYYGHTMGAAGILETILTMAALDEHVILDTKGYAERGVSGKIDVVAAERRTGKHAFVKMLSGFGGCNAAVLVDQKPSDDVSSLSSHTGECDRLEGGKAMRQRANVRLTPADGSLTSLYKKYIGDYPKFYKMDLLAKLGLVASEMLLREIGEDKPADFRDDRAIVCFNRSASLHADRKYLETICDRDNFYPSPSLFVYTLPNIVTGEIAIRHHYLGETSCYILPEKNTTLMQQLLHATFRDPQTRSILGGWIDAEDDDHYEVDLSLWERA